MIPRRARLSRHGFTLLRSLPRAHSAHLTLSHGTTTELPGGMAVVVPKKVAKLSVDRHRLKRQLRALLAPHQSNDRILVLFAKAGAATVPFSVLEAEVTTLLATKS